MRVNTLERLIQFIESYLLPEGLAITANDRVFNEAGIQIAEFDLRITGPVGTTEIDWLIECRDRPSEGAAPREWIQQLLGRREDFGFTNVTAVSITGFSPGAIELAEDRGIDIRSVDAVTPEAFQDWFQVQTLHFVQSIGMLQHAQIRVEPSTSERVKKLLRPIVDAADMSTAFLVHTGTENPFTIHEAWQDFINRNPQIFKGLEPDTEPRQVTIHASYTNPMSRYKVVTDQGEAQVAAIVFVADLSVKQRRLPIASATEYKKVSGDQIAQTITFDIEYEGKQVKLSFHHMSPEGKTIVTVRQSSGA